jgi:hypothetical protein
VCIIAVASNTTSDTTTAVSDSGSRGEVLCWGSGALGQLVCVTVAVRNRKL